MQKEAEIAEKIKNEQSEKVVDEINENEIELLEVAKWESTKFFTKKHLKFFKIEQNAKWR